MTDDLSESLFGNDKNDPLSIADWSSSFDASFGIEVPFASTMSFPCGSLGCSERAEDKLEAAVVADDSFFKGATRTLICMDDLCKRGKTVYDRRDREELKAYVNDTGSSKHSRLKCRCKVNGKELAGRLVIMGDELAKKAAAPYYRLTKESNSNEEWAWYKVELVKKTGMVRERDVEEENAEVVVEEPQKKARGRTTQDLLDDVELQARDSGERDWHVVIPLLKKLVLGDGKGDTAYWHDVGDNERQLEPRDIVGLVDDCVLLDVSEASIVSVVAYDDWVAEVRNPRSISHGDAALIVYMGRSQVKVHLFEVDECCALYVVPDGCNNGVGLVVAADEIDGRPIVGLFAGHYEAQGEFAVVDVIIFPSNDQRILMEQLQTMKVEIRKQSERLEFVEERVSDGVERIQVIESRLDTHLSDIASVESIVSEFVDVTMETKVQLSALKVEDAKNKSRLVEVEDEVFALQCGLEEQATVIDGNRRGLEELKHRIGSKSLREQGNDAFKKGDFSRAIELYSQSIEAKEEVFKSLTNRSLCYRKLGKLSEALNDARLAVSMDCNQYRGYERMAEVYAELPGCIDEGTAASAIAAHLGLVNNCLKSAFPDSCHYVVVTRMTELVRAFDECAPGGVVVLKGTSTWCLPHQHTFRKPVRLVGWSSEAVTLIIEKDVVFSSPLFYAENIRFVCSAQLVVVKSAKLKLRNCVIISKMEDKPRMVAVAVQEGSEARFIRCSVEECFSGGGILAHGSVVEMTECEVTSCACDGLELRYGAKAIVTQCRFHRNKIGVTIVHGASATIRDCTIENNRHEGLLVQSGASVNVVGGSVRHNGKFGVTLQQHLSKLNITGCSIQDNMFWGMTIDSGAWALIQGCNVDYNKCGGIHVGYNYDGDVKITDCSISCNTGLGYRSLAVEDPNANMDFSRFSVAARLEAGLPPGAVHRWTKPPVLKDNHFVQNEIVQLHPQLDLCNYCHGSCNVEAPVVCNPCPVKWCSMSCSESDAQRHGLSCDLAERLEVAVKVQRVADDGKGYTVKILTPHCGTPNRRGLVRKPKQGDVVVFKVQTNENDCDENQDLGVYDESRTIQGCVRCPQLWYLIMRRGQGVLGRMGWTSKKVFLNARIKSISNGGLDSVLEFFTSDLAKWQDW